MIDDIINSAWRDGEDPELAVLRARQLVVSILSSPQPIEVKIGLLEAAVEPLLDAPGGNPMLAYHAAKDLIRENAFLERTTNVSDSERLRRRVRLTVIQARALHCARQSRLAFRAVLAGLTAVENFAEGHEALLAGMANRPPNVAAECVVMLLGIGAASLRRAEGMAQSSREFWTVRLRELTVSYMPRLDPAAAYLYPGTPSLVQVLYMLIERRDGEDAEVIRALHALDKIARQTDRRALSTIPLREVAVAEYEGDAARAAEQGILARPKLIAFPLPRHLAVVERFRFLAAGGPSAV